MYNTTSTNDSASNSNDESDNDNTNNDTYILNITRMILLVIVV